MPDIEQPLPILREEIAAMLLDRDEGWDIPVWARRQIVEGKNMAHDGDCTKRPYTCRRCVADRALADAERFICTVSTYR